MDTDSDSSHIAAARVESHHHTELYLHTCALNANLQRVPLVLPASHN